MIESRPHHRVRLTVCPICGEDLRNKVPSAHIAREHGPTDCGLSLPRRFIAMRAYDGDPDAFVSDNRETLVRIIKHTDDVFIRALALTTLVEYGNQPILEDVERELRKARKTEKEDR